MTLENAQRVQWFKRPKRVTNGIWEMIDTFNEREQVSAKKDNLADMIQELCMSRDREKRAREEAAEWSGRIAAYIASTTGGYPRMVSVAVGDQVAAVKLHGDAKDGYHLISVEKMPVVA